MKGLGVSPGVAIGKAVVILEGPVIERTEIQDVDKELEILDNALDVSKKQLDDIIKENRNKLGEEELAILSAHKMFLEDSELLGKIRDMIKTEKTSSTWSVKKVFDDYISIFMGMEDSYFKERASDLKDVCNRIIRNILKLPAIDYTSLEEKSIIVSKDLTPSDTAVIPRDKVAGFVTEMGGATSHTAVLANIMGIPAVVGVKILDSVNNGDTVLLDGQSGEVYVNPDEETYSRFLKKKKSINNEKNRYLDFLGKPSISKDGVKVEIVCNIGSPEDVQYVIENNGEGVGLYRSEFLFMNRSTPPTEEEQFIFYKSVAEKLNGKPVIIRTLDVGGDKEIPYLDIPKESNPFLGYRAIRYCLENEDFFKTQLRAMLRASYYGRILIMFPMISDIKEIRAAKRLLNEAKEELDSQGILYDKGIKAGIMIETPAAAILSDLLAKEVDFFSIGTNDLVQYTMAVDRMNIKVEKLYSPFNPSVLRLIKTIIDNGHNNGIFVGMCGEAAGNLSLTPVFLGMGLDEFSVAPSKVLSLRELVSRLDRKMLSKQIDEILKLSTSEEVEEYINKNML